MGIRTCLVKVATDKLFGNQSLQQLTLEKLSRIDGKLLCQRSGE